MLASRKGLLSKHVLGKLMFSSTSALSAAAPLRSSRSLFATAANSNAGNSTIDDAAETHFGFQTVKAKDKAKLVGEVFTRVANTYDLMNDVLSVGIHRVWKDQMVHSLAPRPGIKHLDVAGGTGDISFRILEKLRAMPALRAFFPYPGSSPAASAAVSEIIVCDINQVRSSFIEDISHFATQHLVIAGYSSIVKYVFPLYIPFFNFVSSKLYLTPISSYIVNTFFSMHCYAPLNRCTIQDMLNVGADRATKLGYNVVPCPFADAPVTEAQIVADPSSATATASPSTSSFGSTVRVLSNGLADPAISFQQGDAANLFRFPDGHFDSYTIAFGLRNVTEMDKALREAHRVLKKGGRFMCLEFSSMDNVVMQKLYDEYSFKVMPLLGDIVAQDAASYQYLAESIRQFPPKEELAMRMRAAGFRNVGFDSLSLGMVAIHSGYKL